VPIPKTMAYLAGVLALVAGSVPRSAVWAADSKGFALLPPAEVTVLDPGSTPETCGEEPVPSSAQASRSGMEPLRHLLRYEDLPHPVAGNVVLVDVRRPDLHGRVRIPSSLAIPLYALRTKGFLRSKLVVLVGEGHDDALLSGECERLGAAGFAQVRVLAGGINHWQERGGPLEGDPAAVAELNRVTPAAIGAALGTGDWRVAGFGLAAEDLVRAPTGRAVLLPDPVAEEEFVSAIRVLQLRLPAGTTRLARLLLIDRNGAGYAQANELLRQARKAGQDLGTVFYLEGGLDAYERDQALQSHRATVGQLSSAVRQGRCGSCP